MKTHTHTHTKQKIIAANGEKIDTLNTFRNTHETKHSRVCDWYTHWLHSNNISLIFHFLTNGYVLFILCSLLSRVCCAHHYEIRMCLFGWMLELKWFDFCEHFKIDLANLTIASNTLLNDDSNYVKNCPLLNHCENWR